MSAIVGLVRFDGAPIPAPDLAEMASRMHRRAPDRQGVWTGETVGLGHRALYTTPESVHERQPLVRGPFALVADARIDDRDALARRLARRLDELALPDDGRPVTDADLLLAAYVEWGEDCPDHILGDFAFAVWDGRDRKLVCARDPFGVRPLYYVHQPGRLLACATEIKALLAHPEIDGQLNEQWVVDALAAIRDDTEGTIYAGVLRLGSGSRLVAANGSVRVERYFTLEPDAVPAGSAAEYAEGFRERFELAVKDRARSAYPVGAHLSGGLDSSVVTVVARDFLEEQGRGPLHTYSLTYPDVPVCDESAYIEAVTAQGGLVSHVIRGDRLGPLENVDDVYETLDEVLAAGNQHLVWALFKAAHDDGSGVRVVLDGLDGDNVVAHGHNRFREFALAGDWEAFGRESDRATARFAGATHRHNFEDTLASRDQIYLAFGQPVLDRLAEEGPVWSFLRSAQGARQHAGIRPRYLVDRYGRRAFVPTSILRRRRPSRPVPSAPLVSAAAARRTNLADRLRATAEGDLKRRISSMETVRGAQLEILSSPRISYALEGTSHAAAAFGLEVAHPFFDLRLVRYILGLPSSQSYDDGWTRLVLRRAFEHVLPESVAWRVGKAWMGENYARGLFDQDGELLRKHLEDLGPLGDFVDRDELRRLREGAEDGPNDVQGLLGKVATLSMWMKQKFGDRGRS